MTFDSLPRPQDAITIRRAESTADYQACQEAQRLAWGITEPGYVIPIATMVGANLHGGLVLGAFLEDGQAVGISFGFLGRIEERLCLYSQLTGVIPGWQARGLGLELKQVQREFARQSSISLIAWAFDPLQAGNAHFNLERLGARVRRFIDNMYGPRTDALNVGVPTDRLIAEWDVGPEPSDSRREPAVSFEELPALIRTDVPDSGARIPIEVDEQPTAKRVFLEIPPRIAELRRNDPDSAEAWRSAVALAFRVAFHAGYLAVGFLREPAEQGGRCGYLLERPAVGP